MSRVDRIRTALIEEFNPSHLLVTDFSHEHSHGGDETHLKVIIVADAFEKVSIIKRHRQIYALAQSEIDAGLHALQIHPYTQKEMETAAIEPPPKCAGHSRKG